jgi:hypothetical protein
MVTEYYNYQVLELSTRNHQEQVEYLKKLIEYQNKKVRKETINKIIDLINQDMKIKEFHYLLMKLEEMKNE